MLRSSADDMGRYVAAIEGGGVLGKASILSPMGVDQMLTVDPGAGTDEDGQAIVWSKRRTGGRALLEDDDLDALLSLTLTLLDRVEAG